MKIKNEDSISMICFFSGHRRSDVYIYLIVKWRQPRSFERGGFSEALTESNPTRLLLWLCRLSKWILRSGRELRLFPSRTPVVTGPNPGGSPLRALLGPHGHPPGRYGPPPAGTPPLQRGPALLWHHVPPPRGLPQPGAWDPGAPARHLLRSVRPQPAFYLTVAERQRIQQPPVPPPLWNERGHRVVALWRTALRWAAARGRRTVMSWNGSRKTTGLGQHHQHLLLLFICWLIYFCVSYFTPLFFDNISVLNRFFHDLTQSVQTTKHKQKWDGWPPPSMFYLDPHPHWWLSGPSRPNSVQNLP